MEVFERHPSQLMLIILMMKLIPRFLPPHKRKCLVLRAGMWLPNAIFCISEADALKTACLLVCDSEITQQEATFANC